MIASLLAGALVLLSSTALVLGAIILRLAPRRIPPATVPPDPPRVAPTVVRERPHLAQNWRAAESAVGLDLDLLHKLAAGEGGRRTGALKRAGYLTWEVTPAGRAALAREWGSG